MGGAVPRIGRSQTMFENLRTMILKAPWILTFLVSILAAGGVLYERYFGSFLTGEVGQFYTMLGAYVILVLGCTMRGL
jgi:hypothetical protein